MSLWEERLTFSRQLLLTSRFPGLMSRCRIPAECRYFRPGGEKTWVRGGTKRVWLPVLTGPLTSEDLVEEDLDVVGGERLRRHDHLVQVALHQLRDHVSGRVGVKAKRLETRASAAQTARNNAGRCPPACVGPAAKLGD